MFSNAKFIDQDHTLIAARMVGGGIINIPAVAGNRHYDRLQEQGLPIAAYQPPGPSADEVRAEAQRRMIALFGARDKVHMDVLISNGSREAIRLLRKGQSNWTKEEAARAADLEKIDAAMERIRAASNRLEPRPPRDFTDERHWRAEN